MKPWPGKCTSALRQGCRAMTYTPNKVGLISIEDARRILRTIFPNYPELKPYNPAPTLKPIAPSPVRAF
jgi:hypothetical protein